MFIVADSECADNWQPSYLIAYYHYQPIEADIFIRSFRLRLLTCVCARAFQVMQANQVACGKWSISSSSRSPIPWPPRTRGCWKISDCCCFWLPDTRASRRRRRRRRRWKGEVSRLMIRILSVNVCRAFGTETGHPPTIEAEEAKNSFSPQMTRIEHHSTRKLEQSWAGMAG